MFLDAQDFDLLPYSIPNLDSSNTFNVFVDKTEKDFLKKILGVLFFDSLVEGVEALPNEWDAEAEYEIGNEVVYGNDIFESLINDNLGNLPVEGVNWTQLPVNKWLLLTNGGNYTHNGRIYNFSGMVEMLKPLIFSLWMETNTDTLTGVGLVVSNTENSNRAYPGVFISRAWNDFHFKCYGDVNDYGASVANTFYGYLVANAESFDVDIDTDIYDNFASYLSIEFKNVGRKNIFDL